MQRFQLAVYPDVSEDWKNVDRWPDSDARRAYNALIDWLHQLNGVELGGSTDDEDPNGIPYVRFDAAAQTLFDDWCAKLEHRIRRGTDHPVLIEHLAKYRSLIPSLALLIQFADGVSAPLGTECLRKAIAWGDYLESHAYRIYSVAISPDTAEAIALARKIESDELATEFALRDVYRKGWTGLSTRDAATRAVEYLVDLDWLRAEVHPTGGRSKTQYQVNPKLLRNARQGADKADKSP